MHEFGQFTPAKFQKYVKLLIVLEEIVSPKNISMIQVKHDTELFGNLPTKMVSLNLAFSQYLAGISFERSFVNKLSHHTELTAAEHFSLDVMLDLFVFRYLSTVNFVLLREGGYSKIEHVLH